VLRSTTLDKILTSKEILTYENNITLIKKQVNELTFQNTSVILNDIKNILFKNIKKNGIEILKLKISLVHFLEIYNIGINIPCYNQVSGSNIYIRANLIGEFGTYTLDMGSYFKNYLNLENLESEIIEELNTLKNSSKLENTISSNIILDSKLSGQLIHECIGHTSEADNYLSNFSTDYKLGYKWSDIPFNVIDDPSLLDHKGSYQFDEEGNRSFKTNIIQNGIWNNLLHTQETAKKFSHKSSCNARRVIHSSILFPRMSNTYMEPGEYQLNELVKDIDEGIYLCGGQGGKSFKNYFSLTPVYGQFIKNGKLTNKYLRNIEIVGDKFNTISKIKKISGDFKFHDPIYGCDKYGENQLHVSYGSPQLSISNLILRPLNS
jgi:predicted Zn-dependent protease